MKILLVGDYGVIHTRRYLDLILKAGCDVVVLNTGRPAIQIDEVPAEQCHTWPRSGRRLTPYLFGSTLGGKLGDFLFDCNCVGCGALHIRTSLTFSGSVRRHG